MRPPCITVLRCLTILGLLTLFQVGGCATNDNAGDGRGQIVAGNMNGVNMASSTEWVEVDATRVNIRQLFEDLGPETTTWYQHVQTLADPFFEGRKPDTHGHEVAAEYIEFYFRQYGLEPAFPDADAESGDLMSYRQPFEFERRQFTPPTIKAAHVTLDDSALIDGEDYVVLGTSGSAAVTGPVSFVGYAIANGPDDYRSFEADTDLTGRVALVLRYEPLDADGRSQWSDERFSRQAGLARKMRRVADRGAAAVVLVNPPGAVDADQGFVSINRSARFGRPLDIPVIQVSQDVADRILLAAAWDDSGSQDLLAWRRMADAGDITTVDLDDNVQLSFDIEIERPETATQAIPAANVGAILPGKGDLADEWIVIGAHFDHVGDGALGGIRPQNRGQLHPGADDNASGTAGVLVLAQMLADRYDDAPGYADLRSILFLAFDAEEMGLHGSRHFAENPTIPLDRTSLVLNMDMIGRLRGDHLTIIGAGTAEGLSDVLEPHVAVSGLEVGLVMRGSRRSDEANFHRQEVPGIHIFTGMNPEYTTPADQAYTVNPGGAMKVLNLVYDIAVDVAERRGLLAYATPETDDDQPGRGGTRMRLGIQPDWNDELDTGVRVEQVFEHSVASEAGILPNDILLKWNGEAITGLESLFERLQNHKPGDVVTITVKREGKEIDLRATLKAPGETG